MEQFEQRRINIKDYELRQETSRKVENDTSYIRAEGEYPRKADVGGPNSQGWDSEVPGEGWL